MTQIEISDISEEQLEKLNDLIDTLFHTDSLGVVVYGDKYTMVVQGVLNEIRDVAELWNEIK